MPTAAQAPLQWLTPAEERRPRFPRWVRWPLAVGVALSAIGTLVHWQPVSRAGGVLAAVCALALGWWFEEFVYGALGARGAGLKVVTHLMLSALGLPMLAFVALLTLLPFGIGAFLKPLGFTFVWWVSAASVGTATLVIIDSLVSRWGARFRTRLTLAILWLVLGFASAGGALMVLAGLGANGLAEALAKEGSNVTATPAFGWSKEQVIAFFAHHPTEVTLLIGLFVGALAIPAVISACSKLADAAMERLRPMMRGFQLVSSGERTVRVEEAGSTEFIELSHAFNQLVETLDTSEKMERAFGRYVSGQVLGRIRDQHGEAELPPSLRIATVFFADIRGFTAFSERLSPDQVVSLLNRYLARIVPRIDEHLGYLNKFIGDAVVVVFNGPVDQADHAERAIRCALALQQEVAALNAEGVLEEVGELKIGIGIATGPMVCGNVGGPTQMEYTVIGDTVNLSARLTSLAGPGEVWVSEATAKAAPQAHFTALPEVKVKGKERPVLPLRADGF